MTERTDNIIGFAVRPTGRCRVAYTLNDDQPVICTIIGDQPLFYMDYQGTGDEDLLDGLSFEEIESGIEMLQEKISSLSESERGDGENLPAAEAVEAFLEDALFATAPSAAVPAGTVADLESVLRQSRLAAAYLDFAASYGSALKYGAQADTALYDRKSGDIYINPNLGHADRILMAARELRRLWQHRNGALLHPLTFQPDHAVLVNRAQSADLMVSMVRIAWELQLAGEKEPWARIEFSPMADLARAFARESFIDFRTLNNGVAASAVFESWFLSERCGAEDKKLIHQMLADYRGYVFENPQSLNVTADIIVALGSMPFGKNYLAPYVSTIMNDPVFTEVRDRSNANFLWFIKFERSFRETERELQAGESINSHDAPHDASHNDKKRWIGKNETTAEIIPLPSHQSGQDSRDGTNRSGKRARIVDFRSNPGER